MVNARKLAGSLAGALLDLLAPPRCLACEARDPAECGYCAECGEPQPLFDVACHVAGVPVFAGARYAEPLISAIHRFKYGSAPELCSALCRHCVRGIDLLGIEPGDVWVPVPLHPLRLAERGYNQAALLARELSQIQRARVDPRRLCRVRHTNNRPSASAGGARRTSRKHSECGATQGSHSESCWSMTS